MPNYEYRGAFPIILADLEGVPGMRITAAPVANQDPVAVDVPEGTSPLLHPGDRIHIPEREITVTDMFALPDGDDDPKPIQPAAPRRRSTRKPKEQ